MSGQVFHTRAGDRLVTEVSLSGQPTFAVTDPRYVVQEPYSFGYVKIFTRNITTERGEVTVFAPITVNGLAALGVELAELVAGPVDFAPARPAEHPPIPRRPGESIAALNARKYEVMVSALLAGIERHREQGRAA